MKPLLRRLNAVEQTAAHLRGEIKAGRWTNKLPGVQALAADCDVSHTTIRAALLQLESEKMITSAGTGRCREVVVASVSDAARRTMRVMILLSDRLDATDLGYRGLLIGMRQALEAAGHVCEIAGKSMIEMKNDPARIARYVNKTEAELWVVSGATHAVLTWFAGRENPSIAIGGRCLGVPIASVGVGDPSDFGRMVRNFVTLGHRRIVYLCPRYVSEKGPSKLVEILSSELAACGVAMSRYHVPDFDETPTGLQELLARAFRVTPPTALIVASSNWMATVLAFLARRGLRVPQDISLFCQCWDPWFTWHDPAIACWRGDGSLIVKRVVRWVNAASRGRADRDHVSYPAPFEKGHSIGPPKP